MKTKVREIVVCVVCNRTYASVDGKPRKHYVLPKSKDFGEIQYLTSYWEKKQKEFCPGSYLEGKPL